MERYKIIFLDIDGVFNSESLVDKLSSKGKTQAQNDFINIDELTRFIYFISQYNIKLVITSSWRIGSYQETINYFNTTLLKVLVPYIVGVTPRSKSGFRGKEIEFFIYANDVEHEKFRSLVKDNQYFIINEYCIIDDDNDMTDEQKKYHFVQTNWLYGLNESLYPSIKKILKIK